MFDGIVKTCADGEVIFSQGDLAADLFVIRSGAVRIVRETSTGRVELAVFGEDDFFGEMGLFVPGPRTATATAVGETTVEVIDRPTFMAAVDNPVVWQMCARMSERIKRMDEALGDPPAVEIPDDAPPVV